MKKKTKKYVIYGRGESIEVVPLCECWSEGLANLLLIALAKWYTDLRAEEC
jgi:hypothetical protein